MPGRKLLRLPATGSNTRQRQWRCRVFALLVMFFCTPLSFGADDAAEYQQKLKELKATIEKLKHELDDVKGEKGKLQKQLEKSESDIGELENKVDSLNREIDQQDQELQSLQQQQQELQQQRQAQQQQIATQVQSAYRAGPQGPLKMLLNQESPERITRLNKYHDYLLSARSDKLASYRATLDKLNAIEPDIIATRDGLKRRKDELAQQRQRLQSEQRERSATLKKLEAVIANKDAELASERQNSQRLNALLAEMTATLGSANPSNIRFSRLQGKLPWPTEGKLRHSFGSRRVGDQLRWEGMVIEAPSGAPVQAVHSGHVIFADYLRGHGLLVIIDHGEGFMSLYGHNQSLLKQLGDYVDAGEAIARVGNSGGQNYSGLYFEIRHRGQPTNPNKWLARA
ncbi:murein hydrolase activator EnvC [Gilvimarinus sp. DA14]|uniref:murein hydrolase activator EnvC family protein n=1 Tax=Gilvimarinus sp. DA14 TaxID=2956798 RepID=UPI0020B7C386|nr:peptidoglycan DD-metalloendopeptidase family protein [Gilvimarinus sp. DA14]UTF58692.1 peptidoglycan DD-metalloendopeptidase family protein [Gilvimarinus sp. DA14]